MTLLNRTIEMLLDRDPDAARAQLKSLRELQREALAEMRREAAHYYADHFDWRGQEPPAGWDGPKFFPPAEKWRLEAWLDKEVPGTGDHVSLPTSTGKMRDMHIAGQLVFEVDGGEVGLGGYLGGGGHGVRLRAPGPDRAEAHLFDHLLAPAGPVGHSDTFITMASSLALSGAG